MRLQSFHQYTSSCASLVMEVIIIQHDTRVHKYAFLHALIDVIKSLSVSELYMYMLLLLCTFSH